ncbi:hypothetical protein E4O05_08855 [Treponema sp. OMZ 787]|uniref:hypothetical protein n=1 Tax=Treponema sp. OMZ 787 TaxID=2563669 RepID=UPI0020A259BF|nr:hypothetical protein [Treponema sp. OMZ 787]UTC61660.1 hypothetical protein E4O05_08855 [Treponema sp. OMZ 787]
MSDFSKNRDDRVILIASKEKLENLNNQIDWTKLASDAAKIIGSSIAIGSTLSLSFPFSMIGGISSLVTIGTNVISSYFLSNEKNNIFQQYKKKFPYPVVNINAIPSELKFPPQHPVDGVLYASSDCDCKTYIPFYDFHRYMRDYKLSDFIDMCAGLGARYCKVLYAEEDGKNITESLKLSNIPTSAGNLNIQQSASFSSQHNFSCNYQYSFNKPTAIRESHSLWLNSEPSWKKLQEMRLKNDVSTYNADFTYLDEMGITGDLAVSLVNIGLNLGGEFRKIVKTIYKFEVVFWEK